MLCRAWHNNNNKHYMNFSFAIYLTFLPPPPHTHTKNSSHHVFSKFAGIVEAKQCFALEEFDFITIISHTLSHNTAIPKK
mmetsp:Transcript_28452/g.37189  ORF Transcript_28452/g.37189 Transcript_28452/m.37189 type:complete len:80 (+) Transcript_28452:267-506(+)